MGSLLVSELGSLLYGWMGSWSWSLGAGWGAGEPE